MLTCHPITCSKKGCYIHLIVMMYKVLFCILIITAKVTNALTPIDDNNIHDAVNMWLNNRAKATATFGHIKNWDVSEVTNMSELFSEKYNFNANIANWNVSKVTNMSRMFYDARKFNGNLSNWNTSNVSNMQAMFHEARSFNSNLSNWNTSNVTDMAWMFSYAFKFNGDIKTWNTSNVRNMNRMFYYASEFNGDLSTWNTSHVTDMREMFRYAYIFKSNLSNWDTSNVTDMSWMFSSAYEFNKDLSKWNVWNVQDMRNMFNNAKSFNQSLCWNTNNSGVLQKGPGPTDGMFEGTAGGKLLEYPNCLPTIKFKNKAANGKYCMKAKGTWNNAIMKTSLCSSPNILQKFQFGNDGLIYLKKNPSKCIKKAWKYLKVGTCPNDHNNPSYKWDISQYGIFYWEEGGYSKVLSIENDEASNLKKLELVQFNDSPKTQKWTTTTSKK